MTPREFAWHISDNLGYSISKSSMYRILRSFDGVTSPNFILLSMSDSFKHPTRRVHESLNNVTPADVFFYGDKEILNRRDGIKRITIILRRLQNLGEKRRVISFRMIGDTLVECCHEAY